MVNEKIKEDIRKITDPKDLDDILTEIYKMKRWNSVWQWSSSLINNT